MPNDPKYPSGPASLFAGHARESVPDRYCATCRKWVRETVCPACGRPTCTQDELIAQSRQEQRDRDMETGFAREGF